MSLIVNSLNVIPQHTGFVATVTTVHSWAAGISDAATEVRPPRFREHAPTKDRPKGELDQVNGKLNYNIQSQSVDI